MLEYKSLWVVCHSHLNLLDFLDLVQSSRDSSGIRYSTEDIESGGLKIETPNGHMLKG